MRDVHPIPVAKMVAGPHASDRLFEAEHLHALAQSLAKRQQTPIVGRTLGNGEYFEVIAGERRRRAAELANLKTLDARPHEKLTAEQVHELSARHNAGTKNPLERAEGVLRTLNAHLSAIKGWTRLAGRYPTALYAVRRLILLALRDNQADAERVCAHLGLTVEEFHKLTNEALDLYYGPITPLDEGDLEKRQKRRRETFSGGDALLITYPESLRAKLRLNELKKSHAQAINQVADDTLREELMHRTIDEGLNVAAVRALALEANINHRLTHDPGVEQLKTVLADTQRVLGKYTELQPRSRNKALKLATDLNELLRR